MNWNLENINEEEIKNDLFRLLQIKLSVKRRRELLQLILSCIDLTTLEGKDNDKKAIELCQQARNYSSHGADIPNVAAVCLYPPFAATAKNQLKNTAIKVACVAGAFPSAQSPLEVRLMEVNYALANGADEIDMVISRGRFLEGDYDFVFDEITAIKEACGNTHLKVILETGELQTASNIKLASEIAIAAGANFIKTSTGKMTPAATLEAFYVMLKVIKQHYDKTGVMVGIKPAGGISEVDVALQYVLVLENILGENWMNNQYFRIGASRLANKVLEALLS